MAFVLATDIGRHNLLHQGSGFGPGLGTWDMGLGTWDMGPGTWGLGTGHLGTWDWALGDWDRALGTCIGRHNSRFLVHR